MVWVALGVVYLVWGSTYLAIRVTVETIPPLLSAGIRFLIAGSIAWGWLALRRGRSGVTITARELGASALVGGALLLGGNGLVTIAENSGATSSVSALIIASVPLWVVVWRFVTRERVARSTLAGTVIGFAGVALLVLHGDAAGATLSSALMLVAASAFWATGSFFSKRLPLPEDPFVATAAEMLCGGVLVTIVGVVAGETSAFHPSRFSAASMWGLAYLVFAGSLLAFTAYVWLLKNAPISKVATYAYVNPVVAIFLGWAILSERISATKLVGAGVILASVAFIVAREVGERRANAEAIEHPPVGGVATPSPELAEVDAS
jgi:drug/metabolite transporter (DMT)-like permease